MHDKHAVPLALVSGIYEAALEPALWPQVLKEVRTYLDASQCLLMQENLASMESPFVVLDNLDPEQIQAYAEYYVNLDPFFRHRLSRPAGTVTASHLLISEEEYTGSEFYQDFLRPLGAHYSAGVMLQREGTAVATFGMLRSPGREPFSEADLDRLRALQPHLRRGYQIGRVLAARELERQTLLALLEHLPTGVLLVDEQRRVTFVNKRAEAILASRDGLTMTQQGLSATSPAVNARLLQLVREAVGTGAGTGGHPGGALTVPSASGRDPYHVLVTPLPTGRTHLDLGPTRVCAAIFVQLRDAPPALDAELLRELFGLTPAETRVALALVHGRKPGEIAEEGHASRFTVRSQLSAIYEKLGVRRQAEAVQRILSSPAALGMQRRATDRLPEAAGSAPAPLRRPPRS